MAEQVEQFDPTRHLITVQGGAAYLPVAPRIQWLRNDHPNARIVTELIGDTPEHVTFRATITLEDGTIATGHAREALKGGRGFNPLETCETSAVGRALAALGYGTLDALEDEAGNGERIVDSPVVRQMRPQPSRPPQGRPQAGGQGAPSGSSGQPATEKQLQFLRSIARERGVDADAEIHAVTQGSRWLTRQEASSIIDKIKAMPPQDADGLRKAIWMRLRDVYGNAAEPVARKIVYERYDTDSTRNLAVEDLQRLYTYVSGPEADLLIDYPMPENADDPHADISDF